MGAERDRVAGFGRLEDGLLQAGMGDLAPVAVHRHSRAQGFKTPSAHSKGCGRPRPPTPGIYRARSVPFTRACTRHRGSVPSFAATSYTVSPGTIRTGSQIPASFFASRKTVCSTGSSHPEAIR